MKNELMNLIDDFRQMDPPEDGRGWSEHLADHLISKGVTISICDDKSVLNHLICETACAGGEEFGNCPSRRGGRCSAVTNLEWCAINALSEHLLSHDIVPVVRCKDCEYSKKTRLKGGPQYECEIFETYMDAEDYCRQGERKEK